MRGVTTNVYSRKTSEKPERCGLRTLIVKGSGVVFTHGESISTPRVRHKRRQPLIKCTNMTSICFIFPFTFFMSSIPFVFFYLFVVDKGVSLAPTYSSIVIRKSDLRSSFKRGESSDSFYLEGGHLRHWTSNHLTRSTKAGLFLLRILHRRGNQTYVVLAKGSKVMC